MHMVRNWSHFHLRITGDLWLVLVIMSLQVENVQLMQNHLVLQLILL